MPYTIIGGIGEMIAADNADIHNKANILTLNNVVMLCDNVNLTDYTAGETFLTLSEESFFPDTNVNIPIVVNNQLTWLTITTDGELKLPNSYETAVVCLNGIMFSVNSKYYTPEIGNVFNNGTSPLSSAEV